MRTFYTHDNGGRPFCVKISDDNTVYVHKQSREENIYGDYDYSAEPDFTFDATEIFIGRGRAKVWHKRCDDEKNETDYDGSDSTDNEDGSSYSYAKYYFTRGKYYRKDDGNSILIRIGMGCDFKYIYIGESITKFTALAKIVRYESEVGNSDVPYPYAVDELGNYYLLIESVILTKYVKGRTEDPYRDGFYNKCNMMIDDYPEGKITQYFLERGREKHNFIIAPKGVITKSKMFLPATLPYGAICHFNEKREIVLDGIIPEATNDVLTDDSESEERILRYILQEHPMLMVTKVTSIDEYTLTWISKNKPQITNIASYVCYEGSDDRVLFSDNDLTNLSNKFATLRGFVELNETIISPRR